jgi:FkbM family methyltransferase
MSDKIQTTNRPRCGICKSIENSIAGLYAFIFARPSMQFISNSILKLALRGVGYNNCCDPKSTGEEKLIKLISKHNPQFCIDIGANKGHYSASLLNLTQCKILAFEPLPKAFGILSKLQAQFPNRLTPINKGVGDKNALLDLHFGAEDSELASFSPEASEIAYVGQSNKNIIQVEVVTLDDFLKSSPELNSLPIDLLKIDTEGFEYEVLVGSKETIEKKKPKFIQIEYNWHQLFRTQSLYLFARLLPDYTTYQLLPYGSGLNKIDVKRPESNIYHYSNFVFVRNDIVI